MAASPATQAEKFLAQLRRFNRGFIAPALSGESS
jgi:hypothetical protein